MFKKKFIRQLIEMQRLNNVIGNLSLYKALLNVGAMKKKNVNRN